MACQYAAQEKSLTARSHEGGRHAPVEFVQKLRPRVQVGIRRRQFRVAKPRETAEAAIPLRASGCPPRGVGAQDPAADRLCGTAELLPSEKLALLPHLCSGENFRQRRGQKIGRPLGIVLPAALAAESSWSPAFGLRGPSQFHGSRNHRSKLRSTDVGVN